MASFGSLKFTIFEREERKQQYQAHIRGLNAYDRHKKFINDYGNDDEQSPPLRRKEATIILKFKYPLCHLVQEWTIRNQSNFEYLIWLDPCVLQEMDDEQSPPLRRKEATVILSFYGKEKPSNLKLPIKTDQDTLREGYRFIRSEEDDMNPSWEQRLVKRYYDKLFKEYCLADMSQYKSGKIGLRWRTEKEVISGKGQFICGNKHCNEKNGLASYEVNFCYFEAGENKQALVKLVTCESCAQKLNYKRQKEKEQLEKREQEDRRKRNRSKSDDDLDEFQERKERRRKGKRTSISASDHKIDDDDNFDEFLEEMFP